MILFFVVRIAADMRLGLGHMSSASSVCLDVLESISNAGTRDSSGTVQLSGKPGESGSAVRPVWKSWKPGGRFVCFVSSGVMAGERGTHIE